MKTCTKCGKTKPRDMFSKNAASKDGLQSNCKACSAERYRRWHEQNADAKREYSRLYCEANAEAMREYNRRWREQNPEKERERHRRWREQNAEKAREKDRRWREANAEAARAYGRHYSKANPHIFRASAARRRASLVQSTPAWSDGETVARIYRVAALATRAFGEQYHVDHIVPLRGKNATGLHVHCNLRVIPARENSRKNAKLDEQLALDRAALARSLGALILRARAALEVL